MIVDVDVLVNGELSIIDIRRVVRGSTIVFEAQCDPLDPDNVKINFSQEDDFRSYSMTRDPASAFYAYELDTAGFGEGIVYWAVEAQQNEQKVERQGWVNLIGNWANA